MRLIPVPEPVAMTAAAALETRAERGGGGTARAIALAHALTTGAIRPHDLGEIRLWHQRNPDAVVGETSTLLGGLYGGAPAKAWTAAALNPDGTGAMIALPVDEHIAKTLARPDGEPADAMHVTLFHLGSDASQLDPGLRDRIRDVLAPIAPKLPAPVMDLSHVERFTAYDEGLEPVVVVSDEPNVYLLRALVKDALDAAGVSYSDNHAFRAHVTIGYYPPGDGPEQGDVEESLGTDLPKLAPQLVRLHWGDEVDDFHLSPPDPVTAAAPLPVNEKLARLCDRMNRTDRATVAKIHGAANVALDEAVRSARGKLAMKGDRNTKTRTAMAASAGQVTPALLAAVGVTEEELLHRRFEVFGASAYAWFLAAEKRKLRAAAEAMGLDPDEVEQLYDDQVERRSVAASAFLVAGLGVLARSVLSGHPLAPPDQPGEYAGPVPFGFVREAWNVAARGAAPPTIDDAGAGAGDRSDVAERATHAGRTLTEDVVRGQLGDVYLRLTWQHGEPLKPFRPHEDLHGASWLDADPGDILDADPAEWPYVSQYQPGDHDGCTCWLDETYETVPVEAP